MIQIASKGTNETKHDLSNYYVESRVLEGLDDEDFGAEDCAIGIRAKILHHAAEPSTRQIGFAHCRRINLLESSVDNDEKFDCLGNEALGYYLALFDQKTDEPFEDVSEFINDWDQAMIIERVALSPRHRGKGIASHVIEKLIRTYASEGCLVMMHPRPLSPELGYSTRRMRSHKDASNLQQATAKLRDYAKAMDFREYKKTGYFVREKFPMV